MAILNITKKENELVSLGGKIFFEHNGLNKYFLKQRGVNSFSFSGSIDQLKPDEEYQGPTKGKIFWDISKYEKLTITFDGAKNKNSKFINNLERMLTNEILEKAKSYKSDFYKMYQQCQEMKNESAIDEDIEGDVKKMNREEKTIIKDDAQREVSITVDKKQTAAIPNIPKEVSDFMQKFKVVKAGEALLLAINKYNDAQNDIALLEERLSVLEKEDIRLKQKIEGLLYDKEQLTIMCNDFETQRDDLAHSKEEAVTIVPEDPDDDPNGGQSIPAFDVAELKAQLKAEILAELREELKASSVPAPVKIETKVEEPKKEVIRTANKITLPKAKETDLTSKKEEPKQQIKEEIKVTPTIKPKKELNLDTITYDELCEQSYQVLQKIGKVLSLGEANVAKREQLIQLIAAKLKLTKVSANDTGLGMKENKQSLNIKKSTTVDYSSIRKSNTATVNENDLMISESLDMEETIMDQLANAKFNTSAEQDLANFLLGK